MDRFDVIVVGGGSAGCVVAAGLSGQPGLRVLLLERGPRAERNPETLAAGGYGDTFANDEVIWERFSVPQPGCLGRRLFMGSGTGMGGSGAVNGMIYVRGAAADYASWPPGWQWADLRPSFEALERQLRIRRCAPTGFSEACLAAARQTGFRESTDLNDGELDGVVGYEWMNHEGERRMSSYAALLAGRDRPNLCIETGATVRRVLLGADAQVRGVEYELCGVTRSAEADEVILCAGALESPKLLMLSGLGPAAELRQHRIPVLRDLPAVGAGLQDHPNVTLFFAGRRPVDAEHLQLYGFQRVSYASGLPLDQPDTCYVFYPARLSLKQSMQRLLPGLILPPSLALDRQARAPIRSAVELAWRLGALRRLVERVYGIVVILGKPQSRGTVRLASADPAAAALVDPAYFSDAVDLHTLVEGARLAQRLAGSPALAEWGARRLAPSPLASSPARFARWIRRNVMTTFHFAGTCRMGADAQAVVDARLCVRGVRGLRVADASVIPELPVAPINAASMVIGYRAARFAVEELSGRAEGQEAGRVRWASDRS